jgi:hypothetical protein
MIASGALVTSHASSLTKELSSTKSMDIGTPSRSLVEQEPLYKVRACLAIAELRALNAKWRERRKLVAWCDERRGYGVAYIGAQASTTIEMNQAPPWLRYTKDQEDACKDWGPAELGVVQPHHGCTHAPRCSSWPEISSRCTCMHRDSKDASVRLRFNSITT